MGQFRTWMLFASLLATLPGCASFPKMKMPWLPGRAKPDTTAQAGNEATEKAAPDERLTAKTESRTKSETARAKEQPRPGEAHDAALLKLIDEELADADATEKYEVYQRLKDVDPAAVPRLLRAEKLARQFANHTFDSRPDDRNASGDRFDRRESADRERFTADAPDPAGRNPFAQDDEFAERRYPRSSEPRGRDYASLYEDERHLDRRYEDPRADRRDDERRGDRRNDDVRVASARDRYSFPGDDYGHSQRPPGRSSDDYRRYYGEDERDRTSSHRRHYDERDAEPVSGVPLADGSSDFRREADVRATNDRGFEQRPEAGVRLASTNASNDAAELRSPFRDGPSRERAPAGDPLRSAEYSKSGPAASANGASAATLDGITDLTRTADPTPLDAQWQEELQNLISRAHAELPGLPAGATEAERHNYIARHVYLRMLYFVAGQQERAMEPIPGAPAVDQEFWQQMFWAVANYFDTEGMPDGRDRATQTITQLRSAVQRLQENARLELHNVAFGHKISSFGDYERFERDTFSPGQPVLVYAEVSNFKSEPTADGRYRTVLKSTIEVYKAGESGDLVKRIPFQATEDLCRNQRQDYFHSYEFTIPQRISLGPHVMKLTVEDQLSHKVAEYTVNFTVE